MKIETLDEFLARGGKIQKVKPLYQRADLWNYRYTRKKIEHENKRMRLGLFKKQEEVKSEESR